MKLWSKRGSWASKIIHNKIQDLDPGDIKSIAVIRHAALGDMVLTRAFLTEARKAFPNASITLSIVSNYTRGTPEDLVDRVHVAIGSDINGVSYFKRYKSLRELGDHDIIFDLASTSRSRLICLFNKAKIKIGFPYRHAIAKMIFDISTPRSDLDFEVTDMLKMLNMFGVKTDYPYNYAMPGDAVKRDRPYMIYFIGASTPAKVWPAENFTKLLGSMASDYPEHDHLVLEGIKEWENADAILEPVKNLDNVGRINTDTIEATAALLKGATLLVSNDTGVRHVGIVCDTPTVGIFYDVPFRYWPRYPTHDVVFDEQGKPSADSVRHACEGILNYLDVK